MDVFEEIIPFEVNSNCREKIKESLAYRFLKYPEDLQKCKLSKSGVLYLETGDSLGNFTKDHLDFRINEHWSERMKEIAGNPTPICCGFKMHPSGSGFSNKEGVKWECSQCGIIIKKDT